MKQVENKQLITLKSTLENINIIHSITVSEGSKNVRSMISCDGALAGEATLKEGVFKLYLITVITLDKVKVLSDLILSDYQEIETTNYGV
jgi:hypothetical protein